jgi:UDP-3-O-[3-hydroxymyristoyl] N-acetylglucosamine deacetylase
MNNQLLRALLEQADAYEMVSFDDIDKAPEGFALPVRAW